MVTPVDHGRGYGERPLLVINNGKCLVNKGEWFRLQHLANGTLGRVMLPMSQLDLSFRRLFNGISKFINMPITIHDQGPKMTPEFESLGWLLPPVEAWAPHHAESHGGTGPLPPHRSAVPPTACAGSPV